ncbi:MAG: tRNA (adenosine(37)-N6)-dimethylallyltransferase MiaA [Patescibacteria group bacterium]
MSHKPKIIVVVGPTAVGKSEIAVRLAKRFNGEVISADSRQVYKGLDIGSGKITETEMRGVPHYLLDVADPKKVFTVADYKTLAEKAIFDILNRGKVPIICGGTGFYIDTVVNGIEYPDVPANQKLRNTLSKKTTEALFKMLQKLDPKRAKTIDSQNMVRLIRAIEIVKALGSVPKVKSKKRFNALTIGLDLPDTVLKEKISKRILARMGKGMVAEVRMLHKNGVPWKRLFALGLEYRIISLYLQHKLSKQEMIATLEHEIWQYVRRQRAWFRRDREVRWFGPKDLGLIKREAEEFLN